MHNDIAEILVSEKQIKDICKTLGKQITIDYQDKKPILVGLLKGCVPFLSDLSRQIDLNFDIAYMSVSSYHGGISSSGDVKIKMDLDISIKDRDVLIVEDIVDTANTIVTIVELFKHRGASSVKVCTLLDNRYAIVRRIHRRLPGLGCGRINEIWSVRSHCNKACS